MKINKIGGVILAAGLVLMLAACGRGATDQNSTTDPQESKMPEWLQEFYNGNYEYRRTSVTITDGQDHVSTVLEGKRISSPYKEYVKVVEPEDTIWSEAYYYGDGDQINALLNTRDTYISQKTDRNEMYPYGYGEKLTLKKNGTKKYNNISCDVYTAEYTADVEKKIEEEAPGTDIGEMTAQISQQYYVDPKENRLVYMVTDLSDYYYKVSLGTLMMANNMTLDEAKKSYGKIEGISEDRLEILSYDDSMTIDIPDVKTNETGTVS